MALDDTSPTSQRVLTEVIRNMSGPERLRAACELSQFAIDLTRAGIRDRLGDVSEELVDAEHYRLVYGGELADAVLAYRRRVRNAGSRSA